MQFGAFKKWLNKRLRRILGIPYKPKVGEKYVVLMWVGEGVMQDDDALEAFADAMKPEGCILKNVAQQLYYLGDEPNVRFVYKYMDKGWMDVRA